MSATSFGSPIHTVEQQLYACRLKLFKVFSVAEIENSLANYQWINPSFSHRAMKRGANQVLWHEGVTSLAHLILLS
jgi:hypothetical protein